jgi:RNA polymerase sigma-70 factor (ECF subfamily)
VSLSALYRHHAHGLYRFALRLTGDRAAAEDLVAETFAVAVAGGGPAQPPSARAFLFGTLRNLALHGRRTAARRQADPAALLEELPASTDLERATAARQELAATLTDLQSLPEETRAALLLRAEGLPYEAIAGLLGTSVGAAKVRVHRARVALAARRTTREGATP